MGLLVVLYARVSCEDDVHMAVRALRHAAPASAPDACTCLLLCDLAAAPAPKLPEDAPLLRALQSGVMAMAQRCPGRFLLLVRGRVWSDSARAYLGDEQPETPALALARLLSAQRCDAPFAAASFAPASLRDRFDAVLVYGAALACTPDTPARMLRRLRAMGIPRLRGRVVLPVSRMDTPLRRLLALGYTPNAVAAARRFAAPACPEAIAPVLYTAQALAHLTDGEPAASVPEADGCLFLWRDPPALPAVLRAYRMACLHAGDGAALLPPVQLALLLLSALTGSFSLAAATLFLPELPALRHVKRLPGALLRTALLPVHAALAGDALLARAFARSSGLRLQVPRALFTPEGCAAVGAVLIVLAVSSAGAIVPLLFTGLLWLAAPLIMPALDLPAVQRIPLSDAQTARLRDAALSACLARPADLPPAMRVLDHVVACMLGALEPDEAARKTLAELNQPMISRAHSAVHQASLLCAAQFFRERMADCDAALRPLPGQLEALVRSLPLPAGDGRLAVFLRAARTCSGSRTTRILIRTSPPDAADLPFLAPDYPKKRPGDARFLPMTHPHAFLRRPTDAPAAAMDDAAYLCLISAALDHPLHGLLMRSPVCAPYAPLLSLSFI